MNHRSVRPSIKMLYVVNSLSIYKTPFTRYWIQMNPICLHTVLAFRLHEDDDEYGMKMNMLMHTVQNEYRIV